MEEIVKNNVIKIKELAAFSLQMLYFIILLEFSKGIVKLVAIPLPDSIVGMLLLLFFLKSGIIKMKNIEKAGNFLLKYMLFMFIPIGAGLIQSLEQLSQYGIPFIVLTLVSALSVIVSTGFVSSKLLLMSRGENEDV
jgi:holin-like protein